MAWARYDDELPMNRKVGQLLAHGVNGAAALGLHVLANTWARHNGTAGHIPDHQPALLIGDQRLGRRLAELLTIVGMFDPHPIDGWTIHDFDDFSDPKDDGRPVADRMREISAARAVSGRAGGLAKASKTSSKPGSKKRSNGVAVLEQTSGPGPVPVVSTSVNNSSPSNTRLEGLTDRKKQAIERYATICWEQANQSKINDPAKFRTSKKLDAVDRPELDQWLEEFPDATGAQIGAWLTGDTHSMRNYERQTAS
jgi:hypothetical protein